MQRLVDSGRITPEEARYHPRRSVLMRVLSDMDADPELDMFVMPTQPGDRWLLCSDGFRRGRRGAHAEGPARWAWPPGRTADGLLKFALDGGAPDNVTIVIVDVGGHHPLKSGTATIVGAAANPQGMRSPPPRPARPNWLHPVRQAANEPTHFEPEAQYLEELIEEDHRRAVRRRFGWITGLIVVLALIAAALFGGYAWTQTRFFVGSTPARRDLPGDPAGSRPDPASHVYKDTEIQMSDLPAFDCRT